MMERIEQALKDEGFGVLMTKGETAQAMNCTTKTVDRHRAAGRLPHTRTGGNGQLLFLRADVARVLAGR